MSYYQFSVIIDSLQLIVLISIAVVFSIHLSETRIHRGFSTKREGVFTRLADKVVDRGREIEARKSSKNESAEDSLSVMEKQRLEKHKEMNERITKLKSELAMNTEYKRRTGTTADELHPGVKNIPHDAVPQQEDIFSEEVAD